MANLNQEFNYSCTRATQFFHPEKDHVYYLECYGGAGGYGGGDDKGSFVDKGGRGGFAKGYYLNTESSTWVIEVGGMGRNGGSTYGGDGGYYLGGRGGNDTDATDSETGGGGGGATTINKLLTGGGGSGGGSPNTSLPGQDVTQLHADGKGSGGSGGKGWGNTLDSAMGQPGGVVEGGTPPAKTLTAVRAEPGKNYLGKELMYATHGTCATLDNGSAKITCVAKTPEFMWMNFSNNEVNFHVNFVSVVTDIHKTIRYKLGSEKWQLLYDSTKPESLGRMYTIKVPVGFKDLLTIEVNNGFITLEKVLDFKPPTVTFSQEFSNLGWIQGNPMLNAVEVSDDKDTDLDYDIEYYIKDRLFSSVKNTKDITLTPPLLYTPMTPHLVTYDMYVKVRAKQSGDVSEGMLGDIWSDWFTSPTVTVHYNVPPSDMHFECGILPYYLMGENTLIEWSESTDANGTPVTYEVVISSEDTILTKFKDLTKPYLSINMPKVVSKNISLGIEAMSEGKVSNPLITPKFAITDVNITDCILEFPRLTTNVTGEFKEIKIQINGDTRIKGKTENLTNFELPIFYFKKGLNRIRLIAIDRNDVEIDRTWEVNLTFDESTLELQPLMDVKSYTSFNSQGKESFTDCTELGKSILDLGKLETTVIGSSSEGANSITQKLVVTREKNDDTTHLRLLQVTGAID